VAVADSMGTPPAWVARSLSPTIPVMDSLALRVFEQAASRVIKKGALRVVLPNGRELFFGQKQMQRPPRSTATTLGQIPLKAEHGDAPVHVTLRVFDTNFFVRAIKGMDVGLGEAYMYGEYDVDNLTNWVLLLTHNIGAIDEQLGRGMLGLASTIGSTAQSLYHKSRINSITGSRKNIHEHYDLGNDMYKLFLDDTMTYSAGIFRKPDDSLKQSQYNKLDALLAKAKVQKDHHVLEIGCGWGSMAIRAAQTIGCRVTGVTISDEQFGEAKARVAAAGLETLVNIVFLDYRELPNKYGPSFFDAAVSCEMIEAVGHEHLPIYFGVLNTMVKPGGRVAIQAITSQDHKYEGQLQGCDFIKRHIFPGSVLPSMQVMKEVTHGQTFLRMDEKEDIGLDYATTLRLWHEAWIEQESAVKALGYDDIFFRKWRFYFSYCEAAFAAQYIYDFQISWLQTKPATAATGTNSTPEQQSHTSSPSSLSWVRDHLAKPKAISPWLLLLVLVCALCWPQIVTSLQQ
jgi:cyclopropane-fatty-acyl-phospholipid synthase